MKDLMLDLETLGCNSDAVIVQIGACYFDRATGHISSEFLSNVDIQDCLDCGLAVNGSTIEWWMKQNSKSWLIAPETLVQALTRFQDFVESATLVWSHATFDIPILQNAFAAVSKVSPVYYRYCRDIRTLIDLSGGSNSPRTKKTHNALEDCRHQVVYCCEAFKKLSKLQG